MQPSASGQFPGQVLQQGNVPQGGGVTFMSPVAPGSQFLVSTPTTTTPIAGPGQVFMQSTPDGRTTQPVMFSTPISPATGNARHPIGRILKLLANFDYLLRLVSYSFCKTHLLSTMTCWLICANVSVFNFDKIIEKVLK